MTNNYDVAIVGGGIVGLAYAWCAARRGLKTLVLERSRVAEGASVRNFGMIWPIGQPTGELHDLALTSRQRWLELAQAGAIDVHSCGSLHVAHREDEWAVLEEFASMGDYEVDLLTRESTLKLCPAINPSGLKGAMYSASELRVDPRLAIGKIATWLNNTMHVETQFNRTVIRIDDKELLTANGERWHANRIIVCGGSDFSTLFPQQLAQSSMKLCKLQMLSVNDVRFGNQLPHVASGLTLRHYTAFEKCASLAALKNRIAEETPELDQFGIHVMASFFNAGRIVLGDSHEYDDEISPFDKPEIELLMIRELQRILSLGNWDVRERWHGIYAKHPSQPIYELDVSEGVSIAVGTSGAGMTLSFGLAERTWNRWEGTEA